MDRSLLVRAPVRALELASVERVEPGWPRNLHVPRGAASGPHGGLQPAQRGHQYRPAQHHPALLGRYCFIAPVTRLRRAIHAGFAIRFVYRRFHEHHGIPGSGPYPIRPRDRKSTRLNSSHVSISYAVFCLKKKKIISSTMNVSSLASGRCVQTSKCCCLSVTAGACGAGGGGGTPGGSFVFFQYKNAADFATLSLPDALPI